MAGEYVEFHNNVQPALNETNVNLMQQLIKQDIQAAVSGDTLPVGVIMPFGSDTVPENWLLCNGQAVSREDYQQLFNTIGTTFGQGDGFTTFNLPDLRDRVPIGKDTTDTDFDTLGKIAGEREHTLTIEEIPSHVHNEQFGNRAWIDTNGTGNVVQGNQATYYGSDTAATNQTANTGGGQPHNITQPSIATNYIIKAFQSAGVVATVVDSLNSTSAINALSANQGKVLKELLEGTVLYDNSTGTSSNFTLSETSANYTRIIVEAKNVDESSVCIVPEIIEPNGKRFSIITINTGGGYTKTYIGNSVWQISGDSITKYQGNALTVLNKNGATEIQDYDNVVITKVIGYKY